MILARIAVAIIDRLSTPCPSHLDECESCREVDCTQGRWEVCTRRLVAVAERRAEEDARL